MRRLLVEKVDEDRVVLSGEQHHRLTRVLRLRRGDMIRIFDGRGREFEAVIDSADRAQTVLAIKHPARPAPEPRVRITLCQAVPRGDAMERVIQKSVEIGVAEIVPIITRRNVARPLSGDSAKLARWRKIGLHAVEQSGRARLVPIGDPMTADALIPRLPSFDLILAPHIAERINGKDDIIRAEVIPSEAKRSEESRPRFAEPAPLRDVLNKCDSPSTVAILVGPEGGFAAEEIQGFQEAGARMVSLGPRVLRSETAGLVAATIVLYHFGEMG